MVEILGLGVPVHDTGAALLKDGEIVSAINEERLSREKRELRFPSSAVNYLLEQTDKIDRIALSTASVQSLERRIHLDRKQSDGLLSLADSSLRAIYSHRNERAETVRETVQELVNETSIAGSIEQLITKTEYVDHHRAHAASAYYTSGFNEATVLTVDSAGDGLSSTAWAGKDGELERIATNDSIDSLGVLWTLFPTVFGFKGAKHAGKFMGLAPYAGEIPEKLRAEMAEILQVNGLNIVNTFRRKHADDDHEERILALKERFGEYKPQEVAHALQDRTETVLTTFASTAIEETGYSNIALAGGVMANVKVNQRIYGLSDVSGIFVHQNMGDGGLGLGAALDIWARDHPSFRPTFLDDVYLGPSFSNERISRAVSRAEIPENYKIEQHENQESIVRLAADLLADGEVINLFTGRMEYGPRALGNRSILYQPTDPSAISWLNDRLDRTEFMPFAPVTLTEYADECYVDYDPERCKAADFMTMTFECTEKMKDRSPGAVHIDGTARPQIIDEDVNPLYYRILQAYHDRTDIPTLINTSFNMHGEPIVCKPSEALRSFLEFGTRALIMEDTTVLQEEHV